MVLVSFGKLSNVREWWEANSVKFPFQMVLDPEMKLYRELGLKRSVAKVWSVSILVDFAEREMAGTAPLPHFEGDDVHLLGGEFISDSSGKLVVTFSGAGYTRPSTDEILATLDEASS